jgi:hypothetical protein
MRRRAVGLVALLALAIQGLLPLLLGAELAAVARSGEHGIFELCAFGHLHPGGSGPAVPADRDPANICPICVALQASPAFTAPAAPPLPLPRVAPVALVVADLPAVPRLPAPAAYRSRAPPIG